MTKNFFNPILTLVLIILVGSSILLYNVYQFGQ